MNVLKEAKNVEWHAEVVKWKFLLSEREKISSNKKNSFLK